jgi:hypothetical protein
MPDDFADEFADADLKDLRRSRRLPMVAAALAGAPAESITAASGGWAECMAAFRLLNNGDYDPIELIRPHSRKTVGRCADHGCAIAIQDTSELDFSHMKCAGGLGPLNDERRRGFYLHAHYVVSEQGLPLGVLDADIVVREDGHFGQAAARKKLPIAQKESGRWVEGYRKACGLARELPGREVFSVSDREGDIFELYREWHLAGPGQRAAWVVRASQDRALLGVGGGAPGKLFEALRRAPVLGGLEFEVPATTGSKKVKGDRVKTVRAARTVRQVVRAMEVTPRPPQRRGESLPRVTFWAILAEEVDPPEGEEPICWLLLTSERVTTLEGALRIIRIYMRRWDIEVLFRVLKTGCRVEHVQLKCREAIVRALMIYLAIAWRILYLTHLGRSCPELPCGCVFDEAEWRAACAVAGRPPEAGEPSLGEFILIVGKLGGHLGRKCDGPPGPQVMWRGLARVRDFACAWRAIHGE